MKMTATESNELVTNRSNRAFSIAAFLLVVPALLIFLAPIAVLTLPLLFIIVPLVLGA